MAPFEKVGECMKILSFNSLCDGKFPSLVNFGHLSLCSKYPHIIQCPFKWHKLIIFQQGMCSKTSEFLCSYNTLNITQNYYEILVDSHLICSKLQILFYGGDKFSLVDLHNLCTYSKALIFFHNLWWDRNSIRLHC